MWGFFCLGPVSSDQSASSAATPPSPEKSPEKPPERFLVASDKMLFLIQRKKIEWKIRWKDVINVYKDPATNVAYICWMKFDQLTGEVAQLQKPLETLPSKTAALIKFLQDNWDFYLLSNR